MANSFAPLEQPAETNTSLVHPVIPGAVLTHTYREILEIIQIIVLFM
jgi:hypothetical protein